MRRGTLEVHGDMDETDRATVLQVMRLASRMSWVCSGYVPSIPSPLRQGTRYIGSDGCEHNKLIKRCSSRTSCTTARRTFCSLYVDLKIMIHRMADDPAPIYCSIFNGSQAMDPETVVCSPAYSWHMIAECMTAWRQRNLSWGTS